MEEFLPLHRSQKYSFLGGLAPWFEPAGFVGLFVVGRGCWVGGPWLLSNLGFLLPSFSLASNGLLSEMGAISPVDPLAFLTNSTTCSKGAVRAGVSSRHVLKVGLQELIKRSFMMASFVALWHSSIVPHFFN